MPPAYNYAEGPSFSVGGLYHLIADTPYRLNQVRIIPQLLPQMADVDVHSPCLPIEFITPDLVQKVVPRQHLSNIARHHFQQLEFLQCQLQLLPIAEGFVLLLCP